MFKPGGPTFLELMKQALSSTREGYDQLAPKFNATPFHSTKDILFELAWYVRTRGGCDRAIDFCTGTGAVIEALIPLTRKWITAIEWSGPMLAQAFKKLDTIPEDGPCVKFIQDDIFALQYEPIHDFATCFGALGHFDRNKRRQFIALAHSALKPGGKLVVDALELPIWSPMLWTLFGFDAVMYARNILIQPPFIMYYLDWLLPAMMPLFKSEQWSSVRVLPIAIKGRPSPFRLLIATKR